MQECREGFWTMLQQNRRLVGIQLFLAYSWPVKQMNLNPRCELCNMRSFPSLQRLSSQEDNSVRYSAVQDSKSLIPSSKIECSSLVCCQVYDLEGASKQSSNETSRIIGWSVDILRSCLLSIAECIQQLYPHKNCRDWRSRQPSERASVVAPSTIHRGHYSQSACCLKQIMCLCILNQPEDHAEKITGSASLELKSAAGLCITVYPNISQDNSTLQP